MVGPVKWTGHRLKNVTKTRWSPASGSARVTVDLVITATSRRRRFRPAAKLQLLS